MLVQVAREVGWQDHDDVFDSFGYLSASHAGHHVLSDEGARSLGTAIQLGINKNGFSLTELSQDVQRFIEFCFDGEFEIVRSRTIPSPTSITEPHGTRVAPFDQIVLAVVRDVLGLNLRAAGAFNDAQMNKLEVLIFLSWIIQVTFRGLRNQEKVDKATTCAYRAFISELERNYGHSEISTWIRQLFLKRIDEYAESFVQRQHEEPSAPLLRTCSKAVGHIVGEVEPHLAKTMAATTYWWPAITSYAQILVELDSEGKISW
jgi:hypothetical protein